MNEEQEQEVFTPKEAAAWLAANVPRKTEQQWFFWLGSNRNPKRAASWRFPFLKVGAVIFYQGENLRRLARLENAKAQKKTPLQEDLAWMYSRLTNVKPDA